MSARPASGVRYVLERVAAPEATPVVYRGFAHLPDADLPLEVRVELPGGRTSAVIAPGAAAAGVPVQELERAAAALIRSATKAPAAAGGSLPRKVVRWRELPSGGA